MIYYFDEQGIRALTIDKDNAPKVTFPSPSLVLFFLSIFSISICCMVPWLQWNPPTLDEVDDEKIDLVFKPFVEDLELKIQENEELR